VAPEAGQVERNSKKDLVTGPIRGFCALQALNRAIAKAETDGPGAALAALDAVAPALDNYHLMHAARGTMLRRLGQPDAARGVFERAALLASKEADRRFLQRQIEELAD
jgi:RNA polymerase sigma-70 factor (ECF subfamily)